MKIVVLGGGISTERQVSLATSTSVCKALRECGHKAIFVDMYLGIENYDGDLNLLFDAPDGFCSAAVVEDKEPNIEAVKASRKLKSASRIGKHVLDICALSDCVFLGLHGKDGEDGKIQATLDLMGIPYTGSDCLSSAMAMDKSVTKMVMEMNNIRTPEWYNIFLNEIDIDEVTNELPIPCAVKIVDGGSSIGVELPETRDELKSCLNRMQKYGNHVIVERKIIGREMTLPILDDKPLSAIEIIPPEGSTFDYVAKYQSGSKGAMEICPAYVSTEEYEKMASEALKLHKALGLKVYSRTDFILDKDGNCWCLEVNTLPGMTANSLIPKAAKEAGYSYPELCEKIIELSVQA